MFVEIALILNEHKISCADAPNKIVHLKFPDHRGKKNFWEFFVNGNKSTQKLTAEQWGEFELEPAHCAIFWNGWLAGLLDPFGGTMADAEGASRQDFIKSLKDNLSRNERSREHGE